MKDVVEIFNVSEEEAEDIELYRETFPDIRDFRAALEDYFHIYDDYAVMTPEDFDKYFAEYIKESESETEEIEDNVIESEE